MILLWDWRAVSIETSNDARQVILTLVTDFFTKNIDRTWRLLENLEAGMIGMNTGNSSAAESPFGGIKESGYGKESGKDVAINEYMVSIFEYLIHHIWIANGAGADYQDRYSHVGRPLLACVTARRCNLNVAYCHRPNILPVIVSLLSAAQFLSISILREG